MLCPSDHNVMLPDDAPGGGWCWHCFGCDKRITPSGEVIDQQADTESR